jgi:hypothetical protein
VKISEWREAVCELLKEARVPEMRLAEKVGFYPTTLHRYLHGERTPKPEVVRRLNTYVGELVAGSKGIPGNDVDVTEYLNLTALLAGILEKGESDRSDLIGGAYRALELLGAGMLNENWERPFTDYLLKRRGFAKRGPLYQFAADLNRVHRQLLMSAIDGRVPAKAGYDALRSVLGKYGMMKALAADPTPHNEYSRLIYEIRRIVSNIAVPTMSAPERFDAERQLADAARRYADHR